MVQRMGQQSEQTAVAVAQALAIHPIAAVLYTDIERDGTEIGPNIAETARPYLFSTAPAPARSNELGTGSKRGSELAKRLDPVVQGRVRVEHTVEPAELLLATMQFLARRPRDR